MPFCTRCGGAISSDHRYCGQCGTALHRSTSSKPARFLDAHASHPWAIARMGDDHSGSVPCRVACCTTLGHLGQAAPVNSAEQGPSCSRISSRHDLSVSDPAGPEGDRASPMAFANPHACRWPTRPPPGPGRSSHSRGAAGHGPARLCASPALFGTASHHLIVRQRVAALRTGFTNLGTERTGPAVVV